MTCAGVCVKVHGARHTPHGGLPPGGGGTKGGTPYSAWKFCSVCSAWIRWDGRWCPCCSQRLRLRGRSARARDLGRRAAAARGGVAA